MIACAQCGKKNKDNATVCKYCGYNPGALQANTMSWTYQNGAYTPVQYQQPTQQAPQYYYDADGRAYTLRYDCKVTPVDEEDYEDDYYEDEEQVMLYPYNPTLVQQQAQSVKQAPKEKNRVAWIGYILALFVDVLAWPVCLLGLLVARKREGAGREMCLGGMLLTLMRVLSIAVLFAVWWGVNSYLPAFFANGNKWKVAFAKITLFGWPAAIGSIFAELAPDGSALKIAGKGYFLFSLVVAVVGILFFDMAWLPLFA